MILLCTGAGPSTYFDELGTFGHMDVMVEPDTLFDLPHSHFGVWYDDWVNEVDNVRDCGYLMFRFQ